MSQTSLGDILEALNDKLDKDLGNLTGTFITQSNITNCISEIPQDIKLDINYTNHEFIIKAGSKVYFGDGSYQILDSDKTYGASTQWGDNIWFFCLRKSNLSPVQCIVSTSRSMAENDNVTWRLWYNTTDNKCYLNNGEGEPFEVSFPVGVVRHANEVGWTRIEQTFNGFGYIGNTIFILPGVKMLCPDSRNADGTLKSNIITIGTVVRKTWGWAAYGDFIWHGNLPEICPSSQLLIQDVMPVINYGQYQRWISPKLNECYYHAANEATWTKVNTMCILGYASKNGNYVDYLDVRQPLQVNDASGGDVVVDYRIPSELNGYTWYRKYRSGWVEQGGTFATVYNDYHDESVVLPIAMSNSNYTCLISISSGGNARYSAQVDSKTTTGFTVHHLTNITAYAAGWQVSGMAAN